MKSTQPASEGPIAQICSRIGDIRAGRASIGSLAGTVVATDLSQKFLRYFVVGGACAIIDWTFFSIFLYLAGLHYLIAGTLSFVIATAVNYVLSVRYVFESGRRARHTEVMLVYLVSGFSVLINLAVLSGLIEFLAVHPMIAKVAGTGAAFGWNFGARYYWIFAR